MARIRPLLILCLLALPPAARAEVFLLMAEEVGCMWCARWDAEIAHIYPKTAEGMAAPLRRYDLHGQTPPDVTLAASVRFTPTFVLVDSGHEVGRIEGYAGADFFWGLLAMMLERAEIPVVQTR